MPRPASFDRETAIDQALTVVWERGYAATGLRDLLAAIGVGESSFYHAFGSKLGLFHLVIDRYVEQVGASLAAELGQQRPTPDLLWALIRKLLNLSGGRGCLLGRTALEHDPADTGTIARLHAGLGAIERLFAGVIAVGQQRGEITSATPAEILSAALVVQVQGLLVYQRSDSTDRRLEPLARRMLDCLVDPGCAAHDPPTLHHHQ